MAGFGVFAHYLWEHTQMSVHVCIVGQPESRIQPHHELAHCAAAHAPWCCGPVVVCLRRRGIAAAERGNREAAVDAIAKAQLDPDIMASLQELHTQLRE
jgi:hypothetical protein